MRKAVILLLMFFSSCSDIELESNYQKFQAWISDTTRLRVLCTTEIVEDMVREVGGDKVHTLALIQGELDPHTYQLVKGDDEKFTCAGMIFYSGLGLEHGPSLHKTLTENTLAIPLGDRILELNPQKKVIVDGFVDPHIWMDVSLWSDAIDVVKEALSQKMPQYKKEFEERALKLKEVYKKEDQEIDKLIKEIPEKARFIVSSHDAFNYFGRRYLSTEEDYLDGTWKKRVAAPQGLSPESQLSLTDIQWILDHLKRYHISVVFAESNVSQDALKKIIHAGNKTGVEVKIAQVPLYADALGPKGSSGETYLKMMKHNTTIIKEQLEK
jgi:manganese/zinc/iron transport system substrate-binding protein